MPSDLGHVRGPGNGRSSKRKKRHRLEWRLAACAGHWPPITGRAVGMSPPLGLRLPGWLSSFEGRSKAVALTGCLLWSWLARFARRPTHHWRSLQCNRRSVGGTICFQRLMGVEDAGCLNYGNKDDIRFLKNIDLFGLGPPRCLITAGTWDNSACRVRLPGHAG